MIFLKISAMTFYNQGTSSFGVLLTFYLFRWPFRFFEHFYFWSKSRQHFIKGQTPFQKDQDRDQVLSPKIKINPSNTSTHSKKLKPTPQPLPISPHQNTHTHLLYNPSVTLNIYNSLVKGYRIILMGVGVFFIVYTTKERDTESVRSVSGVDFEWGES